MEKLADEKHKILEGGFKSLDLGLWYKDREHFLDNYDEFAKTADMGKMGDKELIELYALAQKILSRKINNRNTMSGGAFQRPEKLQDKVINPRFEFLGKLGAEIDKRHKEKGLKLPPTMEQRGL